jgi:restriction system protein
MWSTILGWLGEKTTTFGLWLKLDENTYRRIDNVIIPARDGTTQIDHVLVSVYGIFVIETKNMKGWIFGSENQATWTQSIFGKKHQFQNPLRQNYRHTKCLAEYLGISHDLIHSVVFFIGECEFKTHMPENVLNKGLSSFIKGFSRVCFQQHEVGEIVNRLRNVKENGGISRSAHLDSLKKRHSSLSRQSNPSEQSDQMKCPRCGGRLVEKVAQKGTYAGQTFKGCSGFPACKYILNNGG